MFSKYLNYALKGVMLYNFKAFKGEHWFDLNEITLITGPNNSGKSSLIQGMKLFSEAFSRADFPSLDPSTISEAGGWDNIVNYDAGKDKFINTEAKTIGFGLLFNIYSSEDNTIDYQVRLKYKFNFESQAKSYTFSRLDLYCHESSPLLSLFRRPYTQKDYPDTVEADNPGEIMFEWDTDQLSRFSTENLSFKIFTDYLKYHFREIWWGEICPEEEFYDTRWTFALNFDHIISELYRDHYINLVPYEARSAIFYSNTPQTTDNYTTLKDEIKYKAFTDFFTQFVSLIKLNMKLISELNVEFMRAEEIYHERIILHAESTGFLNEILKIQEEERVKDYISNKLFNPQNEADNSVNKKRIILDFKKYTEFIKSALLIFDLNAFLFVENIENRGYVVNLITRSKKENLADLGKGSARICIAILKIASVVFNISKPTIQENTSKYQFRKQICIEEPEAFLHPNWQSRFADLILLALEYGDISFLIETHSEYLIRKLQFFAAKGKVSRDKILIYYLRNKEMLKDQEPQLKTITIRETGQLSSGFDSGFFDETPSLILGLFTDEIEN